MVNRIFPPALNWRNFIMLTVVFIGGCAAIARLDWDSLYGKASVNNRQAASATDSAASHQQLAFYHQQVEPIINSRCVVCHACYDAPCQLKMTSSAGIERGANKELVYEGTRLVAAQPRRLFIDAQSPAQWRERGFFPVLNERLQSPQANTQASVLARMLLLKQQHPLPAESRLSDAFDVSIDREQQCPSIEQFDSYAAAQPLAGMPYGLPALTEAEHSVLMSWLAQGARLPQASPLSREEHQAVARLEDFLNGADLKTQLSARYIYEHLFSSHLYFPALTPDDSQARYFQLLRSSTAPGEAIKVIATRRPFDDPGVERVYYRLQEIPATIVNKTHQPYAIDQTLVDKWQ